MKLIRKLLGIFILLIILMITIVAISPYPISLVVRKLFDGGLAVAPENFDDIKGKVTILEDKVYPSQFKFNTFDVFMPKDITDNLTTIIWIHGGAFVGGDKHDVYEYATQIAAEGYLVFSMNYERAPEASYPTPVVQVGELTRYLIENSEYKDVIDTNKLVYAGDSAGAHIASQFAMIQNDESYASLANIEPTLQKDSILGMLLYCGPYDIQALVDRANESKILDFFAGKIAWGYLGSKDWKNMDTVDTLDIITHVNASFPQAFITDGNHGTFTQHGLDLAAKLESLGVSVTSKFYDLEDSKLQHEYQFIMNLPESIETFEATISFLNSLGN